jgi:hypothetical protein
MRGTRALVLVALLVAAAACSGESHDANAQRKRSDRAANRAQKRNDPGCRYIVADTGERSTESNDILDYLSDAVAVPETCYDKITFTFEPGDNTDLPPGYTVGYRKPPFAKDPEGKDISSTTEGFGDAKAILYVEFRFASDFDGRLSGSGRQTYRGNQTLRLESCCGPPPKMHHTVIVEWLKEYVNDTPENPIDNKLIWLIGLDGKHEFTVDSASQPPHISIYVMK